MEQGVCLMACFLFTIDMAGKTQYYLLDWRIYTALGK